MKLQSLHDVYKMELQDLYDAEHQLLEAFPKAIKTASHSSLKDALEKHYEETKEHVRRLEEIGKLQELDLNGKQCHGMKGLIEEAKETIATQGTPEAKDAALIAALQRIEHYEIAGYGCATKYADILGNKDAMNILKKTIAEEEETDQKLSDIAESDVNEKAMYANGHGYAAM